MAKYGPKHVAAVRCNKTNYRNCCEGRYFQQSWLYKQQDAESKKKNSQWGRTVAQAARVRAQVKLYGIYGA
jgi:hypothetical protein